MIWLLYILLALLGILAVQLFVAVELTTILYSVS